MSERPIRSRLMPYRYALVESTGQDRAYDVTPLKMSRLCRTVFYDRSAFCRNAVDGDIPVARPSCPLLRLNRAAQFRLDSSEHVDNRRIELRACVSAQTPRRFVERQRMTVRPRRRHRVETVGDSEHAR